MLEAHLNAFFALYKQMAHLDVSNIYVVQDKFPAIIELYKGYIDRLPEKSEILYIAAADNTTFPLRKGCVDLLIDYCSTNEYGIYADDIYLDRMRQYLKPSASVIGTYFYFDPDSRSLEKLRELYPLNGPRNYTRDYFKSGIRSHYHIVKQAEIGVSMPDLRLPLHGRCTLHTKLPAAHCRTASAGAELSARSATLFKCQMRLLP